MDMLRRIKDKITQTKFKIPIIAAFILLIIAFIVFSFSKTGSEFLRKLSIRIGTSSISQISSDYQINIHFLDVGKADCIVIDCGGEYVMIDGGTYDKYDDIKRYLNSIGVDRFAAVVNTHPDKDHIGSLQKIAENYSVDEFFLSPISLTDTGEENLALLEYLKNNNIPFSTPESGDTFAVGGVRFDVLAPINSYDDTNDMSLVIRVYKESFSALLCGDMASDELSDLLDSKCELTSDIIKISHHGSKTGTNKKLLKKVDPKYAVISIGPNNSGLPDSKVLSLIDDNKLLQTSECGNIMISTNCNGEYKITKENED